MKIYSVGLNPNFGASVANSNRINSQSSIQNVSFGNTKRPRNKEQVIFIGAESDPWSKGGGVGTVMKDYRNFDKKENQIEITPYYKGKIDETTNSIAPDKDTDGDYVMHTNKGDVKLRLVYETTMQWGMDEAAPIKVFAPKDDADKLSYFVYIDETASMKKPYDNSPHYKSGGFSETNGWEGDTYAKFSKAVVELLPQIIKDKGENFNPETMVCSDAQMAYAHEYLAQKVAQGNNDYVGMKSTHVLHNMSGGYLGETSKRNMFVNLGATPELIKKAQNDPMFHDKGDEYFTPFVKDTLDENGTANPTMIVARYADKGIIPAADTVSEDYAEAVAINPQAAGPIQKSFSKLYEKGVFQGILNPFEDKSVDSTKPLPNALYNKECVDTDGKIYPAFETYPKNPTYDEARQIKNANKAKLLERLSCKDTTIITGNPNKGANINPEVQSDEPVIRPDLIELIHQGKGDEVPLFVSWGRCDTQKGHDVTVQAFKKFAKTEEGKNAILILGTGLDSNPESKVLAKDMEEALNDPDLKGRIVHIDGWAPAYAMASAADAAIFSSRFEPCGLTDLEAMKYFCTPIVANTQGFKQKNFDPRINEEKDKATSYKTTHEYHLMKDTAELIIDAYGKGSETAKEQVKKEFPAFITTDDDGTTYYDDSIFVKFGQEYNKYIEKIKEDYRAKKQPLSSDWRDWDVLSKDYNFKFNGFARELKDGILEAELTQAMKAATSADDETKRLIFENTKNLDTSWRGNGQLHPSGKSTYELYKERHLDSKYKGATKDDLTGVDGDEFAKIQAEEQNKDLLSRISAYAAGALTGVAAAVAKKTGRLSQEEILNKQVKTLENKLKEASKQSKRNMAITGVATAIVVGLGTHFATKKFLNKNKNETGDLVMFERPTEKNGGQETVNKIKQDQRSAQAPMPKLANLASTPSLAEFQSKLNNK